MLTAGVDAVDAGLWASVTELAAAKGVSKQALSKRVGRLVEQGALVTREGPRGVKLVNVAAYDRAVGDTTDVVRATNGGGAVQAAPGRATAPVGEGLVYAREQARNAAYAADLKKLELDERLAKLLPTERVVEAMTTCAAAIVRSLDRLPSMSDDLAAAVAREGSAGARRLLKEKVLEMRETLAREMAALEAQGRAETDEAAAAPPDAAQ